jgi:hypothetical protein
MARKKTNRGQDKKALATSGEGEIEVSTELVPRPKALVFVSHDSRDADLAEAFAHLLTDVSGGTLKSFRSSDKRGSSGIDFGTEWYKAIMSQLGDATDVVALLTQRSIDRPWILYEAGVAKGKLDTNVLGIALGVPLEKVSTGPFGQFQNCADDEDSLTKLVMQLLARNPEASPRETAVRVQVRVFIERAKHLLSDKGKKGAASESDDSGVAKLFEEVKVMVRELPARVDDRIKHVERRSRGKGRRVHPKMLEELLFTSTSSPNRAAAAWLVFISILKDELPWIYEIGIDYYRALRRGEANRIRSARKEMMSAISTIIRSPHYEEMMVHDEESYMMFRYVPEMIDHFSRRFDDRVRTRTRQSEKGARESDDAG